MANRSQIKRPGYWERVTASSSMRVRQTNHPERRPDEVWVKNANEETYKKIRWSTKRRGNVARDRGGRPVGDATLFPVFVQRRELEMGGMRLI